MRQHPDPDQPKSSGLMFTILLPHVRDSLLRGKRLSGLMTRTTLLALLLITAACNNAAALERVSIKRCYDGDTCTTTAGEKIRLACIDTPELRGRNADPIPAKAARDYLRRFLQGKTITLERITTDRYGRTVGELFANGVNVQQQMVRSGHAEIYWKYAKPCTWTRGQQ